MVPFQTVLEKHASLPEHHNKHRKAGFTRGKTDKYSGGAFIMACKGTVRDAHRISGFTGYEFAVLKDELALARGLRDEGQSKENIN